MCPWRLVLLHHPVIGFSKNLLGSNLDGGGRPVLHQNLATHGCMCVCARVERDGEGGRGLCMVVGRRDEQR